MHTLKRFIQYYAPYKAAFFLDLVCAAIISLVDLAFPQILRTMTKTVVCRKMRQQLCVSLLPIGIVLLDYIYRSGMCVNIMSAIRGI